MIVLLLYYQQSSRLLCLFCTIIAYTPAISVFIFYRKAFITNKLSTILLIKFNGVDLSEQAIILSILLFLAEIMLPLHC